MRQCVHKVLHFVSSRKMVSLGKNGCSALSGIQIRVSCHSATATQKTHSFRSLSCSRDSLESFSFFIPFYFLLYAFYLCYNISEICTFCLPVSSRRFCG